MKSNKSQENYQQYIEEMKEIQENLLSFVDNTDEDNEDYMTFEDLKEILTEQKILKKRQKLKLFLILNISNNHHRSTNFFERIELWNYANHSHKSKFLD